MQVGFCGLGKMGANMVRRLMRSGEHEVVAFDREREPVDAVASEGAEAAYSLEELVSKLSAPRVVWVMVPAGEATEGALKGLSELMEPGDTIIDGGNSYFRDSIRRSGELEEKG